MSISSDFTKASLSPLESNQGIQVAEQEFVKAKQKEAQVVTEVADSNKASNEKNSDSLTEQKLGSGAANIEAPAVEDVNVKMRQLSVGLSFEMTDDGEENIVKVIDQDTGDVVRQIPSEEFLKMSKRLDEIFGELNDLKGNLINSEV